MEVETKFVNDKARELYNGLPSYATPGAAGIDLRACIEKKVVLNPGDFHVIGTGVAMCLHNPNFGSFLYPRSGNACKFGVILRNSVGVIDSDYQNELKACIINWGNESITIEPGERICQLVITPIQRVIPVEVEEFSTETERGQGGFGSTGSK